MYLISDYCHMVHMERYKELLRESERSRLLRAAASGTTQQTHILQRIASAVKSLVHIFHRHSHVVREVIQ